MPTAPLQIRPACTDRHPITALALRGRHSGWMGRPRKLRNRRLRSHKRRRVCGSRTSVKRRVVSEPGRSSAETQSGPPGGRSCPADAGPLSGHPHGEPTASENLSSGTRSRALARISCLVGAGLAMTRWRVAASLG